MTQTTSERSVETVDFGPGPGNSGGLPDPRPGQVVLGLLAVVPLWIATLSGDLRVMGGVGVFSLLCVLTAVLRIPYTGKYLDQILGPWVRWRWHKLTGKHKRQPISSAHWLGDRLVEADQAPPPELQQIRLAEYIDPHNRSVGLVYDRWQRTYTVVMQIEAAAPGIGGLDHLDQTLQGWQRVLRGVAEHGSGIRRFQWLLVGAPDDGTRLHNDYLARAVDQTSDVSLMYDQLAKEAGPTNTIHETYLAIQVDEKPAADDQWVHGGAYTASGAHAVRCAKKIAHKLATTKYRVVKECLEPGELGRLVHLIYRPQRRAEVAQSHDGQVPFEFVWPKQWTRPWDCYVTDGAMHRVFELKWPEQPITADFLEHLSVIPGTAHALSVVYQPLNRADEIKKGEQVRSGADVKDKKWYQELGFKKPLKKEDQEGQNETYERQLLAGHDAFRLTAWALVSASRVAGDMEDPANYVPTREEAVFSSSRAVRRRMEDAELALNTAASDARLTLISRDGVHAQALAHVLPFCMGTEGAWL